MDSEAVTRSPLNLANPPIVEALLDIECDMPPAQQLEALIDPAKAAFGDKYPKLQTQYLQEYRLKAAPDSLSSLATRPGLVGLRFLQDDEKALVQARVEGFSFNRLAPYTRFDDYLPEIERAWRLYVALASPILVRTIRLRFINRILIPFEGSNVNLDDYFTISPRLPDEDRFRFVGFFQQYTAVEKKTANIVQVLLTAQKPEGGVLPVIFDNGAAAPEQGDPQDWPRLSARIQELRALKNDVFQRSLTQKCLDMLRLR